MVAALAACGGGDGEPIAPEPDGADAGADTGADSGMSEDGGDAGETIDPREVEVVECGGAPIPAPADGQTCVVTPGSGTSTVWLRGTVLGAENKVYRNGSVVYEMSGENARIVSVGCDAIDESTGSRPTEIACASAVISPALINAHDHITFNIKNGPKPHGTERFDHRHDWRTGKRGHNEIKSGQSIRSPAKAILFSELRHLMAGATSIAGSGSTPGLLRNLDVTRNNGGLLGVSVKYETFPFKDYSGTLKAEGCDYSEDADDERVLENTIYLPHVAEGIDAEARNEFRCLNGAGEADLIGPNTTMIHGIGLTASDIEAAASEGTNLVWSPRSNIDLYGQTADVLTYRRFGTTVAIGTDWVHSGSMNILRELACADYLDKTHYAGQLGAHAIWEMATINAASALGVDQYIGSLREDKIADIAIFAAPSSEAGHEAVVEAGVEDVALVLRGGQPLYGDANLIDALVPEAELGGCEEAPVICERETKLCLKRDTGEEYDEISAEAVYPVAFCGEPDEEPSCVPLRPEEYAGPTEADADGDGVADADDSCPQIFNPAMPLTGGAQPDFDDDSIGNACDGCATDASLMSCPVRDPYDRDGDGVPNISDVCPHVADPDQVDDDNDLKGNACDACPEQSNPGFASCEATIYAINRGEVAQGAEVSVAGVVSAAGEGGYFFQVSEDDPAYDGPAYSGLFVYDPKPDATIVPGTQITVQATIGEFNGGRQLVDAEVTRGKLARVPEPLEVTADEIVRAGANGEAYEGLLVTVQGPLTVIEKIKKYHEFKVGEGLYIDDILYKFNFEAGPTFRSVTGALAYRTFTNSVGVRIAPRSDADLVAQ